MNYSLEKYDGTKSRHLCPKCGDKHSFVYYVDVNGDFLNKQVGKCNHESSCGYHCPPKEFFMNNSLGEKYKPINSISKKMKRLDTVSFEYVRKSLSGNSTFVCFLCGLFDRYSLKSPTIDRLLREYAIGATKDQSIIYWQIDIVGRVRTGKIMKYDSETGHRLKGCGGINWVHSIMKKQGLLPKEWEVTQCLFGEHLLKKYPSKVIALVESEKSALILAGVYPNYIWLATGGKSQLAIEKLQVLKNRKVIMFPDVDGFEYWNGKVNVLESIGCKVIVSDWLEKKATIKERSDKIDLADLVIRDLSAGDVKFEEELSETERNLVLMTTMNPVLQELVDVFELELCDKL